MKMSHEDMRSRESWCSRHHKVCLCITKSACMHEAIALHRLMHTCTHLVCISRYQAVCMYASADARVPVRVAIPSHALLSCMLCDTSLCACVTAASNHRCYLRRIHGWCLRPIYGLCIGAIYGLYMDLGPIPLAVLMVTDARHTLDDQVEGSGGADCKELY